MKNEELNLTHPNFLRKYRLVGRKTPCGRVL